MMTHQPPERRRVLASGPGLSPGRLAQLACLLEVTACKPGNVHRLRDLPNLHFVDFLLSAVAIAEPLDRAADVGVGAAVLEAIEATRRVVATNTNLGMVLLLAPLAAVPAGVDLAEGVEDVLASTTVEDARAVYRAIRLAQAGGLGTVPEQDIADEPTLTLQAIMCLAADRDLIARQYANGFREVLGEALPALQGTLAAGRPLETAIVSTHLNILARHPDSLIARKAGLEHARAVSQRASERTECRLARPRGGASAMPRPGRMASSAEPPIQSGDDGRPGDGRLVRRVARWDNRSTNRTSLPRLSSLKLLVSAGWFGGRGGTHSYRFRRGVVERWSLSRTINLLPSPSGSSASSILVSIILFGSQARGTANVGSDIDLLIVGDRPNQETWSRRREIGRIRRALPLIGRPIDILLFTPEEVESWRHTTNHVVSQALREGMVLYERP